MGYLTNVLAFCLPITLFIFWGIIGYAALAILYTQRNLLQNLLLAPSVGLAITLLPIFWLNYFGLPVIEFARIIAFLLFVISVGLLCWVRPTIPLRHYSPFALLLFVTLLVIGYSLLKFGFSWLSYTNDDMTNYCLGALRFLHNGYYALPDMQQLIQGRDSSLYYWFFHVPGLNRAGSELYLAWLSGITGLMPDKVFMPLIIAMYLTLVSMMGALVYTGKKWKSTALTVCIVLTFSAMLNLGVLYQLIAQVVGLSLFSASALLLLRTNYPIKKSTMLRHALLTGMVLAAFFLVYPEIVPILALAFFVYYFIFFVRGGKFHSSFVWFIGVTALVVLILWGANITTFLATLQQHLAQGFTAKVVLFPYFLIPSGLAEFWGFHSIGGNYSAEFLLSIEIFVGAILLIFAFITAIWLSIELYSVAIITLIMFGMGIPLFIRHLDFGLFKLAMYIQPFILSTLVIAWFKITQRPAYRILPVLVLIIAGMSALTVYLKRGEGVGIFDVPNASRTAINVELVQLLNQFPNSQQIVLDTPAVELAKEQMLYLKGRQAYFPSAYFLGSMLNFGNLAFEQNRMIWHNFASNKSYATVKNFVANIPVTSIKLKFALHDPDQPGKVDGFEKQLLNINKSAILIANAPGQTIFNRWGLEPVDNQAFVALPLKLVSNHLIFINSDLGLHYYLGSITLDLANISLYSLERDYFYPTKTYASIGRYLLFQVLNPSRKARLVLDITSTFTKGGQNKLPLVFIIGEQRESLPFVGRGSARIFSPPIDPQIIANNPYVAIDMGPEGYYYSSKRSGLMNWYGSHVAIDSRKINAYARDISLISAAQYAKLKAPANVSNFPADLANPDLEYSGIYEDGWISEAAFFMLQQPREATILEVKGMVPTVENKKFKTELTVLINNKIVMKKELGVGEFDVKANISMHAERCRVELHFSNIQILPGSDGRFVAAKIDFIGFRQ